MKLLERISHSFRIARRFRRQLEGEKKALWTVGLVTLVATSLEVLRPWPLQWITDRALAPTIEHDVSARTVVLVGAIAALLIAVSRAVLEYVSTLLMTRVGHSVTRRLRERVYRHLTELSPDFHARHKSGDLLVRLMGDIPMVRTMLVDSRVHLATRCVLIVAVVAVMVVLDPLLTACALAVVPILLFCVRLFSRQLTIAVRKQRRKEGAMADFLDEAISATDLIQSLGRSEYTVRQFKRSNRRTARAGLKAARATARLQTSVEVNLAAAFAVTLGLGSLRVLEGHLSLGELLVFLSYVRTLLKPVRSASKNWSKVAKGAACGERILEVLDQNDRLSERSGSRPAPERPEELRFSGVGHVYADGTPALRGVDAGFERGQLTALFGPSGAGKSTITALALRLFDPTEGSVTLDGIDLRELDLDSLRASFGLSMQNTVLFGDSVRDNLLLGRPEASDDELQAALRTACAFDFVDALPDGLDTVLGSRGVGLSGGQRKRLCLARALLRDSPILVVDEPFAGLDQPAARGVLAALQEAARDRIVMVVTHDTGFMNAFDRVVLLEDGQVVAQGTHGELKASRRRYAEQCGHEDPGRVVPRGKPKGSGTPGSPGSPGSTTGSTAR